MNSARSSSEKNTAIIKNKGVVNTFETSTEIGIYSIFGEGKKKKILIQ